MNKKYYYVSIKFEKDGVNYVGGTDPNAALFEYQKRALMCADGDLYYAALTTLDAHHQPTIVRCCGWLEGKFYESKSEEKN